jgi:hypothetical protein
MTTEMIFYGVSGSFTITDPLLANTSVYKVKSQGLGFDIILTGTPTSRQVLHDSSAGKLTFAVSFAGDPSNDVSNAVYVLFRS